MSPRKHLSSLVLKAVLLTLFPLALTGQPSPTLEHPRLFLSADQLAQYRARLDADSTLRALSDHLLAVADGILDLPPEPRRMIGRRMLRSSRTVLKRICYLGYAYRLTGKPIYVDRARREMLNAATYADFNPEHFLDVAEMAAALAIGYDWFYGELSPDDRATIATAVHRHAFRPALEDTHWWTTTTNNWNQVCHGGLGLAAIAFYEDYPETADSLLQRARQYLPLAYAQYAPDGAYAEGAMYFEYGTSFHAMFLDAYTHNFPDGPAVEIPDYFKRSGTFLAQVRGPAGYYNYGDSREDGGASASIYYLAQLDDTPGALYYQYPALREFATGDKTVPVDSYGQRLLPLAPLWLSRLAPTAVSSPPVATSFHSAGMNPIGILRTSFSDTATFLAAKGGTPSMNHGHMDIGSFVLDARGCRWVFDPGMHDYEALESQGLSIFDRTVDGDRWKVNRYTNYAHSTLTVNGKHQVVDGFAHLAKLAGSGGWRATRISMDSVYLPELATSARTLALHSSGAVLIHDRLHTPIDAGASVRWAILISDEIEMIDDRNAVLRRGDERMHVRILSPADAVLERYSSQPQLAYEEGLPGTILLGFTANLPENTESTLTVLLTDPENIAAGEKLARRYLNNLPAE